MSCSGSAQRVAAEGGLWRQRGSRCLAPRQSLGDEHSRQQSVPPLDGFLARDVATPVPLDLAHDVVELRPGIFVPPSVQFVEEDRRLLPLQRPYSVLPRLVNAPEQVLYR